VTNAMTRVLLVHASYLRLTKWRILEQRIQRTSNKKTAPTLQACAQPTEFCYHVVFFR
jgi:hypothetical protein